MKLNIAVIDDIPHDIETAADMVKMYFEQNNFFSVNISGFENADSFFKAYTGLFSDCSGRYLYEQYERSGTFSKTSGGFDEDIVIIFMSTTTEFVFETFRALPHGYLRKPFSFDELRETMD